MSTFSNKDLANFKGELAKNKQALQTLEEREAQKKTDAIQFALDCLNDFQRAAEEVGLEPHYKPWYEEVGIFKKKTIKHYSTEKRWAVYEFTTSGDYHFVTFIFEHDSPRKRELLAKEMARKYKYSVSKLKEHFNSILSGKFEEKRSFYEHADEAHLYER